MLSSLSDLTSSDSYNSGTDCYSDFSFDEQGCFYGCEPEYTKEELDHWESAVTEGSTGSSSSEEDVDSSRLENLHWCQCKNCVIGLTFTVDECLCCKECNIIMEKLQRLNCITEHEDFENLILNESVLELAYVSNRRYSNNYVDIKKLNNK